METQNAAWPRLSSPAGSFLLTTVRFTLTRHMHDGWNDGEVIEIHPEMMGLTLRIAAKALFDSEMERDNRDMEHAITDLTTHVCALRLTLRP